MISKLGQLRKVLSSDRVLHQHIENLSRPGCGITSTSIAGLAQATAGKHWCDVPLIC